MWDSISCRLLIHPVRQMCKYQPVFSLLSLLTVKRDKSWVPSIKRLHLKEEKLVQQLLFLHQYSAKVGDQENFPTIKHALRRRENYHLAAGRNSYDFEVEDENLRLLNPSKPCKILHHSSHCTWTEIWTQAQPSLVQKALVSSLWCIGLWH